MKWMFFGLFGNLPLHTHSRGRYVNQIIEEIECLPTATMFSMRKESWRLMNVEGGGRKH